MNETQVKSLYEVTKDRPDGTIAGILTNSTSPELDHFLSFDPERSVKSIGVQGFDLETVQRNPDIVVDARVMEMDRAGRYILRKYNKEGLLNRMMEADIMESLPRQYPRKMNIREALAFINRRLGFNLLEGLRENLSWDSDTAMTATNAFNSSFTPLFIGPYYRQQYMYRMLDGKSKAFDAYTYNPIAHRIAHLISQFTVGKGVTAEFKDDQAQEWWDKFAKYNKIGTSREGITRAGSKLRTWAVMQCVDGENMFMEQDMGDMLKISALDTATILEVVTDPTDIEKVFYYHQQYATPYNMYATSEIPMTRYVIRQIPADQVFHVKINCFDNEKRGRSDFYTILGWLKRVKDLINANVIKAYFHACYTWDYLIKGSPSTVKAFAAANKNAIPSPGSGYFHNDNVTRTLITPTGSAGAGVENDLLGLMNMISLGSGIPPAYLLGSFAASRAAALTETEPSSKFFFERQSIWDETLHEFADRLFRWLRDKHGMSFKSTECEFSFPEINPMETTAYLNNLSTMKEREWFTEKRCMNMAAKKFTVTSFDPDTEKAAIIQEKKEAIDREFEANKYRSLAETKLQVWQSYFAHAGASEEQSQLGYSPSDQDAGGGNQASGSGGSGGSGGPAKTKSGKSDGRTSGGMSEKDRTSVARGGR